MRRKLFNICIIFLVMALLLVGVTGCTRRVESRETEATETSETPGGSTSSPGTTPAPGETVVSAASPGPSGGTVVTAATPVPLPTQPGGEQPTAPAAPEATSAPAPTAAPPPDSGSGNFVWHTVQPGETVYSIATRYGTTVNAISKANGLSNPNQIYAGQKLKIPTGTGSTLPGSGTPGCRIKHTVQRGEWVWQIARTYGVSPYDILAANGLTVQTANTIHPGTVLCIP